MRLREYKATYVCNTFKKDILINQGEELDCSCGKYCHFDCYKYKTENDFNEELYFIDWRNESCGNYIGWSRIINNNSIIINKDYQRNIYNMFICESWVRSNSDPFGENPGLFSNKIDNLSLKELQNEIYLLKQN